MNSPFYTRLLRIVSLLGAFGVIFGAFGAHFLKSRLAASELEIIHTGILYLFIHVLITIAVVLLARDAPNSRWLRSAGIFFITGIVLFSGSLFLLATQTMLGLNLSYIGIITPLGGLCFIIGWGMLMMHSFFPK